MSFKQKEGASNGWIAAPQLPLKDNTIKHFALTEMMAPQK